MSIELSIIVPVFNSDKTLSSCLNSILTQTYKRFEVICINDGSSDSSLKILESFASSDARIVIVSKENGGLSSARNAGLDIARGKWVGFVDSDDFIEEDMFKRLVEEIEKFDVDMVGCGTRVIYNAWDSIKKNDDNFFKIRLGRNVKVETGIFSKMDVHVWNKLFKRNLIERYNIRFPYGMYYEDAPFLINYLGVSEKVSFINERLYNYVRSESSIMGETFKKTPKALDLIRVVEFSKDFFKRNNIGSKLEKDMANFMVRNSFLTIKYCPRSMKSQAVALVFTTLRKYGYRNFFYLLHIFNVKVLTKILKFKT